MKNTEYAIVVAGGKGARLKSHIPKQFLELNGFPILMHTIQAFLKYNKNLPVILVLPETDFQLWSELCSKHSFNYPLILQKGGESRFQSVKNGLIKIEGDGLVAIHDGVRPLVSGEIIAESFRFAALYQSAVAAVPLKESIRMTDKISLPEGNSARRQDTTKAMDRSLFNIIQTPQTFDVELIKQAYQQQEDPTLTDDASVAEKAGHSIFLFEGSYENIKITTPEDLILANALLRSRG